MHFNVSKWRRVHTLDWWSERRGRGMVSKRIWLGEVIKLGGRGGRYMPLPKSCKIRTWSLTYKTETNCASEGQFVLLYFQHQELTCNQSVWTEWEKEHVIAHRISGKDGAIPRINVMITQQGDNMLYWLVALLYDQSKTFNSKHFCERCFQD